MTRPDLPIRLQRSRRKGVGFIGFDGGQAYRTAFPPVRIRIRAHRWRLAIGPAPRHYRNQEASND